MKHHPPELYTLLPCRFSAGRKKIAKKFTQMCIYIVYLCIFDLSKQRKNEHNTFNRN